MRYRLWPILFALAFLFPVFSCTREELYTISRDGQAAEPAVYPAPRQATEETRRVLLLYLSGYNSLSGFITNNLEELKQGYIPGNNRGDDVLLVFSHLNTDNYRGTTIPVLTRYTRPSGREDIQIDTLLTWPEGCSTANVNVFRGVLDYVKEAFPARSYGLVFSSHASGWLPEGYLGNPGLYGDHQSVYGGSVFSRRKSAGQEYYVQGGSLLDEEMELDAMVEAIPYHLDYIVFDVCLMGGVEVAYAFKDKADWLALSPTEVMAHGFDYTLLTSRLIGSGEADVLGVCEDYFSWYDGTNRGGATVTLVRCSEMERLAQVCRPLFDKYYDAIRSMDGVPDIQRYDRLMGDKLYYCFYDLKDMLAFAGATEDELRGLQQALDACLPYVRHTADFFFGSIILSRCCGLSSYLPARTDAKYRGYAGTAFLDSFYKEHVAWNKATGFIR